MGTPSPPQENKCRLQQRKISVCKLHYISRKKPNFHEFQFCDPNNGAHSAITPTQTQEYASNLIIY